MVTIKLYALDHTIVTAQPQTFFRKDLVPVEAPARPPAAVHKHTILGLGDANNGVLSRTVGDEENRQAPTGYQVLVEGAVKRS